MLPAHASKPAGNAGNSGTALYRRGLTAVNVTYGARPKKGWMDGRQVENCTKQPPKNEAAAAASLENHWVTAS